MKITIWPLWPQMTQIDFWPEKRYRVSSLCICMSYMNILWKIEELKGLAMIFSGLENPWFFFRSKETNSKILLSCSNYEEKGFFGKFLFWWRSKQCF